MNEPVRLSASGSPLAKQLLLAAKRERPCADAKVEAIAAAVVGSRRSWLAVLAGKPWLVGLCLVSAGVVASAVCTVDAAPVLEVEPVARGEVAPFDVLPRIPESFVLDEHVPSAVATPRALPAPTRLEAEGPPRTSAAPRAELDLLRAARLALVKDDAERALTTLDEHARLHPSGTFGEEAAALRVEALARVDAAAARAAAARFAKRYPDSPYAERVRSVVAGLARR